MSITGGGTRRRFLAQLGATAGALALPGGLFRPRAAAAASPIAFPGAPPVACGARPKLHFVFYTDCHTRIEFDTPRALDMAAGAIRRESPEIVIGGGDFITDGFQNHADFVAPRWDAYLKFHHALGAENFPAIGNHDLVAANPEDGRPGAADPRAVYRDRLGLVRTYYAFDAGGYHFVVLDPMEVVGGDLQYRGYVDAAQLDWLRDDLSRLAPGTAVIAVTHMPLATAFYQMTEGNEAEMPANRVVVNNRDVLDAFAGHNLILVLQGHLHVLESLKWRSTHFVTGGAICGKWWRGSWHGTPEGFCVFDLDGDDVRWRYVTYGWQAQRPVDQ